MPVPLFAGIPAAIVGIAGLIDGNKEAALAGAAGAAGAVIGSAAGAMAGVLAPAAEAVAGSAVAAVAAEDAALAAEIGAGVFGEEIGAGSTVLAKEFATAAGEAVIEATLDPTGEIASEIVFDMPLSETALPAGEWYGTNQQAFEEAAAQELMTEMQAIGESHAVDTFLGMTPDDILKGLDKLLPGARTLLSGIEQGKLNVGAMLSVLTATMRLLAPIGPGLTHLTKLHNVTAGKHIPALLGAAQLLLGKVVTKPTSKDSGLVLDISTVKEALGALGVRMSPEDELGDRALVLPLGNVIAEGADKIADNLGMVLREQSAAEVKRREEKDKELLAFYPRFEDLNKQLLEYAKSNNFEISSAVREGLQNTVSGLSKAINEGVFPKVEQFVAWLEPILVPLVKLLADTVQTGVKIVHEPVKNAIAPFFEDNLRSMSGTILQGGESWPSDATARATSMFSEAMRFGVTAHMLAAAVELCHPTKELGLPQLAATAADLAAFSPITANTIGVEASVALGNATRLNAQYISRTNWPGVGECIEMFLEGRMTWEDLRWRLRYAGWPDRFIDAYLGETDDGQTAVPYKEASARDLAIIYEDIDADDDWMLGQLKQSGFSPVDAPRILNGIRKRTMKTWRNSMIGEALGAYEEGTYSADRLLDVLTGLGLRPELRGLIMERAQLSRTRYLSKQLAASYKSLVDGQGISTEDYRVALKGLGYENDVADVLVAVAEAKLNVSLMKEERAELKTAVRKEQAISADILERQVRLGITDPIQMQADLETMGISAGQARAMGILAGLRALPVPKLPEVLTVQAAEQRATDIEAQAVLAAVRNGTLNDAVGATALYALGIDQEEANARILLALVNGKQATALGKVPTVDRATAEARRIRTEEAIKAYRGGLLDDAGLAAALAAAGNDPAVVEALGSREYTLAVIEGEKALEKQAAEQEKLARSAALKELA
jgi:hypothetical protein